MKVSIIGISWNTSLIGVALLLTLIQSIHTILDADYFIQSLEQPRLCVQGAMPEMHEMDIGNESSFIFHTGKLLANTCTNIPEQQWHFQFQLEKQKISCKNSTKREMSYLYNITSSASETLFLKNLYANITGFFMKYWHNPIEVIPIDKSHRIPNATGTGNGTLFVFKEHGNQTCLQNAGKLQKLERVSCKPNVTSQIWRLFLVTHGDVSSSSSMA